MACHYPLKAWHSKEIQKNGKRKLVFNPDRALFPDKELKIACSRCAGCRLERSRQWAMRIEHEASQYKENCFITLTFDDQHLLNRKPIIGETKYSNWSIWPREWQLFMKRLRQRNPDKKIRYYHCGEYGDLAEEGQNLGRPHYHACIFNYDFKDKKLFNKKGENDLYISGELESLWPYGHSVIGDVTFDSAAYVARYLMKKRGGKQAIGHYLRHLGLNLETGELLTDPLCPEYTTMSKRPGIGKEWFEKYGMTDVYPKDYVTIKGKPNRPPKYYDKLLEEKDPEMYEEIKEKRTEAVETAEELTIPRLIELEESLHHKANRKRREL